MVLKTKKMNAEPSEDDGLRICIMRDARVYNRQLKRFEEKHGRPMYDLHLKDLAPSTELKDAYKEGKIGWDEYVPWFENDVLSSYDELLRQVAYQALKDDITLLCTEESPDNCHRRLVAEECQKYQPGLEIIIE